MTRTSADAFIAELEAIQMLEVASTAQRSDSRILIVDDEPLVRRALRRLTARLAEVEDAGTIEDACQKLSAPDVWTAVIIDWRLHDRFGAEVLEFARSRHPVLACMILTGCPDRRASEVAWAHGVPIFFKPLRLPVLKAFIAQASSATSDFGRIVVKAVQQWRILYGIRPASVEVFRRLCMGESPGAVADGLGISENTYKKHVHNFLERTRADSIEEEVARLLREVAGGCRGAKPAP